MKKFGLIGGLSWHSTVEYYSQINQLTNNHYGDNTSPPLRLINLNQKQIHDLQRNDDWDAIAKIVIEAALQLERLEVEGIAVCANTPHKVFDQLERSVSCPILHIADAVGSALQRDGIVTAGLLGTRFTMSQDFIKGRLLDQYGIRAIIPTPSKQHEIQERIYRELVLGTFNDNTKTFCLAIIESLASQGAEAVILGCTELPLLLEGTSCSIPTVNSIKYHCEAISQYLLQ